MNKWLKVGKIFLILIFLFITFWMTIGVVKYATIHGIYSYFVDSISNLTGLNKYLVKITVILMIFPLLYGLKLYFFSFRNKTHKYIGASILVTILVLYNLGLYHFTKSSYFAFSEGKVMKWYANTPEGIRFFDSEGYDPKYGIKLKPVTPEIIANLEKMKRGMQPQKLAYNSLDEIEFFDRLTGENKVWYYRDLSGNYELFDSPGIHPTYGNTLEPVTKQVLSQIKAKLEEDARIKGEEAKRLKEQRAAREHENFLNRYLLNRSFTNKSESNEVTVLVIDKGNKVTQDISQKVASQLKIKGFNATASFFTGQLVSDGLFERIFNGDAKAINKLELSNHCDYIILGKSSVNFTKNPDMQDMITARASIKFHLISTKTGTVKDNFTISEVGAGFARTDAKELAIERILNKLEKRILKTLT